MNSDKHQWYYLSRQRPDEVLIMKIFDSEEGVEAKCKYEDYILDLEF